MNLSGPAELRLDGLFDALFISDEWFVTMIGLYCDASGTEEDAIIAVGGVVSTAEEWRVFDAKWRDVLKDFGLNYFRMSEFAHSVGQFKVGWKNKESKRRALLDRLSAIIRDHVKYWTGSCVLKSDYDKVDGDYELHEHLYPFTLCARSCVAVTCIWYDAHHRDDGMQYVFEYGDEHFEQLKKVVEKETGIVPVEQKKRDVTPCQAADFAAYEVLKAYRLLKLEPGKIFEKYREPSTDSIASHRSGASGENGSCG